MSAQKHHSQETSTLPVSCRPWWCGWCGDDLPDNPVRGGHGHDFCCDEHRTEYRAELSALRLERIRERARLRFGRAS